MSRNDPEGPHEGIPPRKSSKRTAITEHDRWNMAVEMIEEESADAQSTDPERDWK